MESKKVLEWQPQHSFEKDEEEKRSERTYDYTNQRVSELLSNESSDFLLGKRTHTKRLLRDWMELLDLLQEETEFDSNVFIAIDTIMKMLEVEELKQEKVIIRELCKRVDFDLAELNNSSYMRKNPRQILEKFIKDMVPELFFVNDFKNRFQFKRTWRIGDGKRQMAFTYAISIPDSSTLFSSCKKLLYVDYNFCICDTFNEKIIKIQHTLQPELSSDGGLIESLRKRIKFHYLDRIADARHFYVKVKINNSPNIIVLSGEAEQVLALDILEVTVRSVNSLLVVPSEKPSRNFVWAIKWFIGIDQFQKVIDASIHKDSQPQPRSINEELENHCDQLDPETQQKQSSKESFSEGTASKGSDSKSKH